MSFISKSFTNFTFQSGYIQMELQKLWRNSGVILYIPIWLYSNYNSTTLHMTVCSLYIPIWLYSNATSYFQTICNDNPLHSNLVIFKSIWDKIGDNLGNDFTFQSGYIQMLNTFLKLALIINFTFQSGYIQMLTLRWLCGMIKTLHSNLVIFKFELLRIYQRRITLYIPIWLYSNSVASLTHYMHLSPLHSNLVIFKFITLHK